MTTTDCRPWRVTVTAVSSSYNRICLVERSCGHQYRLAARPERWPRVGDLVDCLVCQVAAMTPGSGTGVSPFRHLKPCDIALRAVTRRWDALLDKTGPDFDGSTTSAWSDAETAQFQRLGLILKRLGDHGTAVDPCHHQAARFIGGPRR